MLDVVLAVAVLAAGVWFSRRWVAADLRKRDPSDLFSGHPHGDSGVPPGQVKIGLRPGLRSVAMVLLLPTGVLLLGLWWLFLPPNSRRELFGTADALYMGFGVISAWYAGVLFGVFPQRAGPILADADGIRIPRIRSVGRFRWDCLTVKSHCISFDAYWCLVFDDRRWALFLCDERSMEVLRCGVRAFSGGGSERPTTAPH